MMHLICSVLLLAVVPTPKEMRGPFPILSTPYFEDGSVDYEGFAREVDWVVRGGVPGAIWCQSNDAVDLLTAEEKYRGFEECAKAAEGRPIVMTFGANGTNTAQMVEIAEEIERVAARHPRAKIAVASRPPDDVRSQEDIEKAWDALAKVVRRPVIFQTYGTPDTPTPDVEVLVRLAKNHPEVFGYVKEEAAGYSAVERMEKLDAARPVIKTPFAGWGGWQWLIQLRHCGCEGLVTERAAFAPALAKMWRTFERGERGLELTKDYAMFRLLCDQRNFPGGLRGYPLYFLEKAGVFKNRVSRAYVNNRVTEGGSFGTGHEWKLTNVELDARQKKELDLLFGEMMAYAATDDANANAGVPVEVKNAGADGLVTVDEGTAVGSIKIMNAVNGAPDKPGTENFKAWADAEIPYTRLHDINSYVGYGTPHTVDVRAIFPDFKADENDPKSYRFGETDEVLKAIRAAGSEPFYRLGQTIEGRKVKKYWVLAPEDPAKWARICEHIIAHYNEGWANGYKWGIKYWEIWNEPDLGTHDTEPRITSTWGGTRNQFKEMWKICQKHLKARFPDIRLGGPALAGTHDWGEAMMKEFAAEKVPVDFYSWHGYSYDPRTWVPTARKVRAFIDKHGYEKCESIYNEWNYVKGWAKDFPYSLEVERGAFNQKGAAYVGAVMSVMQNEPVDMLMYYDARINGMNGMFDPVTQLPMRCYYTFTAWNKLRKLGTQVKAESGLADVYVTAAKGADGRLGIFLVRYDEDNNVTAPAKVMVRLASGKSLADATCHLTDDIRIATEWRPVPATNGAVIVTLRPCSFAFLETKPVPASPKKVAADAPKPDGEIVVEPGKALGRVKVMNAVNGAPGQAGSECFAAWKQAEIPYARLHDINNRGTYGAPHVVDVRAIFTDFDADENDPKSYDFTCTDAFLKGLRASGAEPFYRLGHSIESCKVTKTYTQPPADYAKWARVCEHIIAHYNEGWANGYKWGIKYWEIWNEPDLQTTDEGSQGSPTWGGSRKEFVKFWKIAQTHLKKRFPDIRLGGPALAHAADWGEAMVKEFAAEKVPLDFYSWHGYGVRPDQDADLARRIRKFLDANGYRDCESIYDEWNYVKGWGRDRPYSREVECGRFAQKGAAYAGAVMNVMQNEPVDMLMYYDARVCGMNGLFSRGSNLPMRGYYVFNAWNRLRRLGTQVKAESTLKDVTVTAAKGEDGRIGLFIVRYDEDNNVTAPATVRVRLGSGKPLAGVTGHLTDEARIFTEYVPDAYSDGSLSLTLHPCSFIYLETAEAK